MFGDGVYFRVTKWLKMAYLEWVIFYKMKNKICIDFDGVIYHNLKFHGNAIVRGPKIDGALEAIKELSKSFEVLIHSARCADDAGYSAVEDWLKENEFLKFAVLVKNKPRAKVYLDDRGICFTGDWGKAKTDIKNFKQWQTDTKNLNRIKRKKRSRLGR